MKKQPTLKQVRAELFDTLTGMKAGKVSPQEADATYKLSIGIIDTYRMEIKAVELANKISTTKLDYTSALKQIEKK